MTIRKVKTKENSSGVGYQLDHDRGAINWIYESLTDAITADAEEQFSEMYYSIECNECGARITAVMNAGDITISREATFTGKKYNEGGGFVQDAITEHNKTHLTRPQIIF